MGRPKSRNTTRSEKVMFYLTPETFVKFKKLAHINELTMAEFACELVEKAVELNSERIKAFEEMQKGSE